jgi:hypothetical protein
MNKSENNFRGKQFTAGQRLRRACAIIILGWWFGLILSFFHQRFCKHNAFKRNVGIALRAVVSGASFAHKINVVMLASRSI